MCRNIKRLRRVDSQPSDQELHDAALQFVRKISGFNKPSQANQATFERAVRDVAKAGRKLFDHLEVHPHNHHHHHDHDHSHDHGHDHHHDHDHAAV